jgi:hypothetical protein
MLYSETLKQLLELLPAFVRINTRDSKITEIRVDYKVAVSNRMMLGLLYGMPPYSPYADQLAIQLSEHMPEDSFNSNDNVVLEICSITNSDLCYLVRAAYGMYKWTLPLDTVKLLLPDTKFPKHTY